MGEMLQEPDDNHRDFVKKSSLLPAFLIPHDSSQNKDKKSGIWEGFECQNPKIIAQKSCMR